MKLVHSQKRDKIMVRVSMLTTCRTPLFGKKEIRFVIKNKIHGVTIPSAKNAGRQNSFEIAGKAFGTIMIIQVAASKPAMVPMSWNAFSIKRRLAASHIPTDTVKSKRIEQVVMIRQPPFNLRDGPSREKK
jgi:hypothetical protein